MLAINCPLQGIVMLSIVKKFYLVYLGIKRILDIPSNVVSILGQTYSTVKGKYEIDLFVAKLSFDNIDVIMTVIGWKLYSKTAETLRKCSKIIALTSNNHENYFVT